MNNFFEFVVVDFEVFDLKNTNKSMQYLKCIPKYLF